MIYILEIALSAGVFVLISLGLVRANILRAKYNSILNKPWKELSKEERKEIIQSMPRIADIEPGLLGLVGATATYDAIEALTKIDSTVLEAIKFSAGGNIDSYKDLLSYIHDHFESLDHDSLEGAINRLVGYVGEQKVAQDLIAQGHHVEFPADPNNAGYDLLVDGHPIQIKTTLNESLISDHFDKYDNIPVITNIENFDVAAVHKDVFVDPNLSYFDVKEATISTLDGIHDLHAFDFHIPVVTLLFASAREFNLLMKNYTDVLTSLKNIGLDVAGVGFGGGIGGAIGAALGFGVGGPIGAALGKVVGSLGGALLGKMFTNEIKYKKFNEIFQKIQQAEVKLGDLINACSQQYLMEQENKIKSLRREYGFMGLFKKYFNPSLKTVLLDRLIANLSKHKDEVRRKYNELAELPPGERVRKFLKGEWNYLKVTSELKSLVKDYLNLFNELISEGRRVNLVK
ncbi:hypothetical protein ciss_04380 [Carboxydothermus islandicus]|uniref:Glycine zipper domain-containing protein n=1 Tax=Carboxydothermus islandicus TaxID=661089 RepID=A0A1L8CZZ7_9THEO|nr:hypothetical protein [Carboxydothermus islandicus]GAV24505.1 hypothetical protein ciss_04380 [Carboxydothermus islandicus]